MKKLFLIRHAKSSWKDSSLADFDRPLNKRGKKDAPFMAEILKNNKIKVDIVLSSLANRAKTTAQIISAKLNIEDKLIFKENIYDSSLSTLINILKSLDDKNETVILVAHNPSLNALAYEYTNFEQNIPTMGVLEISFDIKSWSEISKNNARLISFIYPKKYEGKK